MFTFNVRPNAKRKHFASVSNVTRCRNLRRSHDPSQPAELSPAGANAEPGRHGRRRRTQYGGSAGATRPSRRPELAAGLHAARAAGLRTSIDLNHRVKLWSGTEACKWMTEFMQYTDVLITTEEDTERVFGITGKDYADVAGQLAQKFPLRTVAITLRDNP